jgi:acetyl-CoA carboxylase beta subunit/acetyl-CoA carboxylase alpha subunit
MTSTAHPGARDLVETCTDPGSWRSWDEPIHLADYVGVGADADYVAALRRARAKAGTDESVITGQARIRGHDVALIVGEFKFLGGSVGAIAGDRIAGAVRRATAARLPLVAATASGGTRMQEGTPAFVRMIEITRAVVDHKAAKLPYLVYLRHPTTGGVFASWGSLGHVSVAEPGALIGFLGPVVFEALHGTPFPSGVQTAENLVAKGILDAVMPLGALPDLAARALTLLMPTKTSATNDARSVDAPLAAAGVERDAWEAIELTRHPGRPGVRELLRFATDDTIALNGTQAGEAAETLFTALASFDGEHCIVIGQDRRTQTSEHGLGPAALRSARRGMRMAEELGLPLVSVIDTPGADLSAAAEEGALASEIARCLADMVSLHVPTVSVILGQGCGGGALALLPAKSVIVTEHAWLSPLPPEGASAIMFGDTTHAAEMARRQHIRAEDLLTSGTAHVLVPEDRPAHCDPSAFAKTLALEIARAIRTQSIRSTGTTATRTHRSDS